MHLSGQGDNPTYNSMLDRGVSRHIPLSDEGNTPNRTPGQGSHPPSPAEKSKHCLVSAAPPSQPGWSLAHPGSQAKGRPSNTQNLPQPVLSYTLRSAESFRGEGEGRVLSSKHSAQWGLQQWCPPPGDSAQEVVLSVPRLHGSYFVLTSGNQGRRTELYFPSSWKPLINVNWF